MREFLRVLLRHKLLVALPLMIFLVMIVGALYLLSRPALGTVIYRP